MTASDGLLSKTIIAAQTAKLNEPPVTVAAIGTTQGGAAVIPLGVNLVIITATTSTEGVSLPSQVAFLGNGQSTITIVPKSTLGVKVYPAVGEGLNAVATNGSVTIAAGKVARFIPIQTGFGGSSAYRWAVEAGA